MYGCNLSLTSTLDGVSGQYHARQLYLRKRPGTHCVGVWVFPRASLDWCGKSFPHLDLIPRLSSP